MSWPNIPERYYGTKITDNIWDDDFVESLLILSDHTHTNDPSDGGLKLFPNLYPSILIVNTTTTNQIADKIVEANSLGPNGYICGTISIKNLPGAGFNFTVTISLGTASFIYSGAQSVTATSRISTFEFIITNIGSANSQIFSAFFRVYSAAADGAVTAVGADDEKYTALSSVDTTIPQTLSVQVAMDSAAVTKNMQYLYISIQEPFYAP
jgi:hypothetical protein